MECEKRAHVFGSLWISIFNASVKKVLSGIYEQEKTLIIEEFLEKVYHVINVATTFY